jgi:hypothetical protein
MAKLTMKMLDAVRNDLALEKEDPETIFSQNEGNKIKILYSRGENPNDQTISGQ